jgi:hypothetical protein
MRANQRFLLSIFRGGRAAASRTPGRGGADRHEEAAFDTLNEALRD